MCINPPATVPSIAPAASSCLSLLNATDSTNRSFLLLLPSTCSMPCSSAYTRNKIELDPPKFEFGAREKPRRIGPAFAMVAAARQCSKMQCG